MMAAPNGSKQHKGSNSGRFVPKRKFTGDNESVDGFTDVERKKRKANRRKQEMTRNGYQTSQTTRKECSVCQDAHRIELCGKFSHMTLDDRAQHCKEKGICFKCLLPGHIAKECPSGKRCGVCHGHHNTVLHGMNFAWPTGVSYAPAQRGYNQYGSGSVHSIHLSPFKIRI